ncbi:MAG: tetratricopeptide repeat protein [Lachnospira sp.]|nr:tetratricopeptide repeat protein [Lachnospira sp.]MDD5828766.1 tetratricopeptide repeat protein [Lachnospira sp.]
MKCFKCGSLLTANDTCPKCNTDVSVYKETAKVSNAYYNKGLAKAQVRDLTGAVESLKTSIMINKYNIEARNLLGLVYLEMGEVVNALSEWVISKNLFPEDNVAGDYIKRIQSNQNRFELVTNTIKKYNLSLKYAKEGNIDMAVIQLKKVVTQNPQLIKAYQLLALLYIKEGDNSRAKKLLNHVLKIDRNNIIAIRYLNEISKAAQLKSKDVENSFLPKRKLKDNDSKPLSGNDVILPRSSYREPSNGAITIINVLVGIVIGAAVIWFLIMPSRNRGLTEEYNNTIAQYSEQLSSGNVELNSLTRQLEEVKKDKEALEAQVSQLSGTGGSNKLLISVVDAANAYIAGDTSKTAENLIDVDVSALPNDTSKELYNKLSAATFSMAASEFNNKGMQEYYKASYSTAVEYLVKAYKCDKNNVNYVYYAAKCYEALGQTDNAKKYYKYIVDDFSTSGYYREASAYVSSH